MKDDLRIHPMAAQGERMPQFMDGNGDKDGDYPSQYFGRTAR
jgi:hypothetical protein